MLVGSELVAPDPSVIAMEGPASAGSSSDGRYPRNENGQTYGSMLGAASEEDEPDLILVEADSGIEGYVRKADLHAVDGSQYENPSEAARHQADPKSPDDDPVLLVYAEDGSTVIGTWHLGP